MRIRVVALFVGFLGILTIAPESASAAAVYPFCDASSSNGKAWYVDPLRGSIKGDGSKQRPWQYLSDIVFNNLISTAPSRWDNSVRRTIPANAGAPIKPGDTIYLMTGPQKPFTIQGYYGTTLVGYNNNQFITIAAAPGQIPIIPQMTIIGASHFVFRNLMFASINQTGSYAASGTNGIDYMLVNIRGPHDNIVFDSNRFLSQPDVSSWSISDWISKRATAFQEVAGSCISIVNNSFKNVGFAIRSQSSQNVLISGNTIDYFSDDGIDYGDDDLLIENNVITNSIEDGDGFHRDGMQGQPANNSVTMHNIVIRNNKVIRVADIRNPYPGFLQGIDSFNGTMDTITISGNVVLTDAGEGITFLGAHNLTISGNTVLGDGGKLLPCYGLGLSDCEGKSVTDSMPTNPEIRVSKGNTPSSNVTIANNFLSAMNVDISTSPLRITGNVCMAASNGQCTLGIPVAGRMVWTKAIGPVGDNNVITNKPAAEVFSAFNTSTATYSLNVVNNPLR